MKLSIIIVSWNVRPILRECLRSIYSSTPGCLFEIIVVDNASSDDSAAMVRAEFPAVTVIENADNPGFAAATNQGIRQASGDYILLLNPDTIVHPGALEAMVRELDANPSLGACGPKILNADGSIQVTAGGAAPTFRSALYSKTIFRKLGIFRGHHHSRMKKVHDPNVKASAEQLSGAAVMVRASVFEKIGLLDEQFFMYYEDTDLFYRMKTAGICMIYLPDACITHLGGQSTSQIPSEKRLLFLQSLFLFFRKHYGEVKTFFFGLVFKPAYLLRVVMDVVNGLFGLLFFGLAANSQKKEKSACKYRQSVSFLRKHLITFLRI